VHAFPAERPGQGAADPVCGRAAKARGRSMNPLWPPGELGQRPAQLVGQCLRAVAGVDELFMPLAAGHPHQAGTPRDPSTYHEGEEGGLKSLPAL
jgi:hypothetical protein